MIDLGTTSELEAAVLGPHCQALDDADLRRLFGTHDLTEQRLDRLRRWPRIIVRSAGMIVGAATCERVQDEMVVPDVAIAAGASEPGEILAALLDAVESACLAGGSRKIVLSPPRAAVAFLEARGYESTLGSSTACWMEREIA